MAFNPPMNITICPASYLSPSSVPKPEPLFTLQKPLKCKQLTEARESQGAHMLLYRFESLYRAANAPGLHSIAQLLLRGIFLHLLELSTYHIYKLSHLL